MRILLATFALVGALPGSAYAAVVVINNGLDCSNPENLIDHDTYQSDNVYVQNVGCDGTVEYPCASPGDPTEVCLVDGGVVDYLNAFESSTIQMSDGSMQYLAAFDSSAVRISGGGVGGLYAVNSSTIMIEGTEFAVDGNPVPYGALTAQTGTLTGRLASGEPIDSVFHQGGGSFTGRIVLLTPIPAMSLFGKLGLGAGLLGAGSLGVGVLRRRAG